MKKKIKIPFDYKLIGQEGVIVEYVNSTTKILEVVVNKQYNRIVVVDEDNGIVVPISGINGINSDYDLIMYREVKPREVWLNEYEHGFTGEVYNSKENAELGAATSCIRQVKFIEVLEDEQ